MADYTPASYTVRNSLMYAYRALKSKQRLVKGSTISPYEDFYTKLVQAVSPQKKLEYSIPSSEIEAFYVGRLSEKNFVKYVESRVCTKIMTESSGAVTSPTGGVAGLVDSTSMMFSVIWDLYSSSDNVAPICRKVQRSCGRRLWEMFLILDVACQMEVELDDIVDLIQRIFTANGQSEGEETIKSWFGNEKQIDFFTFFQTIVESYSILLLEAPLQEVYNFVCLEFIHQGRLMKKGHVVHNWKWRWFVLSASALHYYESQDNMVLKGAVTINENSQVQAMPESRGHPFKFRLLDGTKNVGYEISAKTEKDMKEWMYRIKLAIQTHVVVGRNLLHRYRLAEANMPKPSKGVVSVDGKVPHSHRALSPSKSVPVETVLSSKSTDNKKRPLPLPPTHDTNRQQAPTPPLRGGGARDNRPDVGLLDSFGEDPPPIPPQRLNSDDVRDLLPNQPRRHSSSTADDIKHIQVGDEDYALVNKEQPKKKKTSKPETNNERLMLLEAKMKSNKKNKPLPKPRSDPTTPSKDNGTNSFQILEDERSIKSRSPKPGGYAKLHFQEDQEKVKTRQTPEVSVEETKPRDFDRTRFDYSTIVFGADKEKDFEMAEKLKKDRAPPPPVEKYNPNKKRGMNKYKSDTRVLNEPETTDSGSYQMPASKPTSLPDLLETKNTLDYAEINFSGPPPPPPPYANTRSKSPQARHDYMNVNPSSSGVDEEQPYVNLPPRIAPRKGISQDSPPVPCRKIS